MPRAGPPLRLALLVLSAASWLLFTEGSVGDHGHDHAGCGHSQVVEAEQRLVSRSLYLAAVSRAKESLQVRASGQQQQQQPRPAAPRVHLLYQLEGLAASPDLEAAVRGSLMPTAVRVLQKMFRVARPTAGALQLPSGWGSSRCIDARVDPSLIAGKGPGVPADYVLFVTAAPCLPGTMAYAGVCAVGGQDSRPIVGAINLCPGSFQLLPPKRRVETVIHELLHAFVFSPSLFPLFRSGDPRRNATGPYGPTTAIASPAVVDTLRRRSGCPTAAGAALEDEGDGGSRGSHWEARLFQGELMLSAAPFAGRSDKHPRLDLTAALLQDSGWYLPRWAALAPLDFGAGAGCGWLGQKARAWAAESPGQRLYCSPERANATTCSYDHQAVSECFKPGKGGAAASDFLNGVAFPYALHSTGNCLAPGSKAPEAWPSLGAWRGPTALCYPVTREIADSSGRRYGAGAGCWDTTCAEGGQLYVSLRFPGGASSLLRCPTGKTLDLAKALPRRFVSGAIACPDNAEVCAAAADSCGRCVHGYCRSGRCHCGLEYVGEACDMHVTEVPDMDAWFDAHGGSGSSGGDSGRAGGAAAGSLTVSAGAGGLAITSAAMSSRQSGAAQPQQQGSPAEGGKAASAQAAPQGPRATPATAAAPHTASDAAALLLAQLQQPDSTATGGAVISAAALRGGTSGGGTSGSSQPRLDALLASLTGNGIGGGASDSFAAVPMSAAVDATPCVAAPRTPDLEDHQQQLLQLLQGGGVPSAAAAQPAPVQLAATSKANKARATPAALAAGNVWAQSAV